MTIPPVPPDPDPALFNAVGNLCAAWAGFELSTDQCIWGMLNIDKSVGRHITWNLDMRNRWQLLMSISERRNPPIDHDFLSEINNEIEDLNRRRNIVVHGLLIHVPPKKEGDGWGPLSWVIFRGTEKGKPQPATVTFVTTTMTGIQHLQAKLQGFNTKRNYTASPFDFS